MGRLGQKGAKMQETSQKMGRLPHFWENTAIDEDGRERLNADGQVYTPLIQAISTTTALTRSRKEP